MRLGSRKLYAATLVTGLALVLSPVTVAVAQSADEPELGDFLINADATGIGASFGDPNASPYPVAAGLIPNALTQFRTGPSGRAVTSIMWPGPLLSNAGSLANVIGTPLPPELVANANYPIKAEATAGAGARDEQNLGPMSALVDEDESRARTALSDFSTTGLVSAARIVTKSRSFVEDGAAVAVAETQLQDVEVAGLVRIESVRTVATGKSDGEEASTDQTVVLSGVTVAGQPATIDDDGLHVGDSNNPNPADAAAEGANQAIQNIGMRAFVTQPIEQRSEGGTAALNSGAVILEWNFFDSGQFFTVVLGGSSVSVDASPGSSFGGGGDEADFFVPPDGGGLGGDSPGFAAPGGGFSSPSGGLGAVPGTGGGIGGGTTGRSGGTGGVGSGGDFSETPLLSSASRPSDRVPLGWLIIGMVGMAMVGAGLHGLRVRAITATAIATTCPNQGGAR